MQGFCLEGDQFSSCIHLIVFGPLQLCFLCIWCVYDVCICVCMYVCIYICIAHVQMEAVCAFDVCVCVRACMYHVQTCTYDFPKCFVRFVCMSMVSASSRLVIVFDTQVHIDACFQVLVCLNFVYTLVTFTACCGVFTTDDMFDNSLDLHPHYLSVPTYKSCWYTLAYARTNTWKRS
jgi:hypothetical protein